jgi:hypothetical protein
MGELTVVQRLCQIVRDANVGSGDKCGFQLLLARAVGTDGCDVAARADPVSLDQRLGRGRSGQDHVRTAAGPFQVGGDGRTLQSCDQGRSAACVAAPDRDLSLGHQVP